jgi:ABC-2 type transport system permease protein
MLGSRTRKEPSFGRIGLVGDGSGAPGGTPPIRVVSPSVTTRARVRDIWAYRETIVGLVRKEIKVKYKGSFLGFLWSTLNPAMYLGIYYVVFQIVLKNGIPDFALFLLTGLLVWNVFQTAIPTATTAVVANSSIVKKVSFPREILAISAVGASLVFFVFQAVVLLVALAAFRFAPHWEFVPLVPFALLDLVVFSIALAVFFSAVNVYMRDTQHLMELVLVAWFWATPVCYPYQEVALHLGRFFWVYLLNPITTVVLVFQRAFYPRVSYHVGPTLVRMLPVRGPLWYLVPLGGILVVSVLLLLGALKVFGRLEGNFAEEL